MNEELLLAQIDQILGAGGLLTQSGMAHSKIQEEYARRVGSGFCRYDAENQKASLNILEAGTGTGKTIGYLVPLLLFAAQTGERVAISTHTRHLQKQIVSEDAQLVLGWVQQITGKTLTVSRRVGMSNFFSTARCIELLDDLDAGKDRSLKPAITMLLDMIEWSRQPETSGLIDDYIEDRGLQSFPIGISADSISLTPKSPDTEKEKYVAAAASSKDADVLVINHTLLIINALRWTSLLDDVDKRPISLLVCDEADTLPNVAEQVAVADLVLYRLKRVMDTYAEIIKKPALSEKTNTLYQQVQEFYTPGIDMKKIDAGDAISEAVKDLKKYITPLMSDINKRRNTDGNLYENDIETPTLEFIDAANAIIEFHQALSESDNTAIVSWSPVRIYPSLRVSRATPGRILRRMWSSQIAWEIHTSEENEEIVKRSYLRAALFTSASLSVPGRDTVEQFDEFASSIGIIRHRNIHNTQTNLYKSFEPSNFGTLSFVLADPGTSVPSVRTNEDEEERISSPEWLDYCAMMIRTAHSQGGRCFVLTLSYRDTAAISERLHDLPDLIAQVPGQSLRLVLAQYIDNPRACLITPTAWEGVNLPGLIQHLVITRIPFTPVDALKRAQLMLHLHAKGFSDDKIESILHNENLSATRKKLKQGFGRAIRSKTDKATIWIADPRFPMPERLNNSLDEFLMPQRRITVHKGMIHCIPRRFIEGDMETGTGFESAKVLLADGRVYQPL